MNTRQVDEYLKRLKRRERFLEDRIEHYIERDKVHYDKAELIALQWAIRYIEDTKLEAADHQGKYFNEKREDEQN